MPTTTTTEPTRVPVPQPARPLYRELASLVTAIRNCEKAGNADWQSRHSTRLGELCRNCLPSGSGIDCGTTLDRDRCTESKLVFLLAYHHMNENGMYDGWTEHTVIVTPSFNGIDIRITGRDRNQIKDYLHDVFHHTLTDTAWQ
jgi:hypothetical protein